MLGLGNLGRVVFGSANDRRIKRYQPLVAEINGLEPEMSALSDDELRAKTDAFRQQIADGTDLDDLLPQAFATVREAAKRTLGQRHFDVQLVGGMVLNEGSIAEMRTGEGKTLVATLPVYLNALAGRGDTRAAIDELRQQIEQRGGTQKTHDRYRELLAAANDEAELARHARRYVSVLMAQDAHAKALQMLQACLASAADYCPDQAEELRPLAEAASKYGRHELAVRVLVNGIKRFAKSKENPALALLAAKLLSEKLGSDAKAVQLLTAVRTRYPDHPLAADIDRQLAILGAAPG